MAYHKVSVDSSWNQNVAGSVHRYNLEVFHCPTQEITRHRKSVIKNYFLLFSNRCRHIPLKRSRHQSNSTVDWRKEIYISCHVFIYDCFVLSVVCFVIYCYLFLVLMFVGSTDVCFRQCPNSNQLFKMHKCHSWGKIEILRESLQHRSTLCKLNSIRLEKIKF